MAKRKNKSNPDSSSAEKKIKSESTTASPSTSTKKKKKKKKKKKNKAAVQSNSATPGATGTPAAGASNYGNALDFLKELNRTAIEEKEGKKIKKKPQSASRFVPPSIPALSGESTKGKQDEAKPKKNAASASKKDPSLITSKGKGLSGWEWFKAMGSPRFVLGPMVGQSELAFRVLCRRYGTPLCYTPMFISSKFIKSASYRKDVWSTCPEDRPLVVQFCANDPDTLLKAARMVEHQCDAIDINFGCPQKVAERQNYGSFLMEDFDLVSRLVKVLADNLSIPVLCKIRIFPNDVAKTLKYAKVLESSGCSLLAVHPRTRTQKEEVLADWEIIRTIKSKINIPLVINGDLWHAEDVDLCRKITGADGYMSAQGLLHNPALFEPNVKGKGFRNPKHDPSASLDNLAPYMRLRRQFGPTTAFRLSFSYSGPSEPSTSAAPKPSSASSSFSGSFFSTAEDVHRQFKLAREYLDLADKYPPGHISIVRRHVFFILFDCFQANLDCYDALFTATSRAEFAELLDLLLERAESGKTRGKDAGEAPRKRSRRRDGSLAPPPWPVGGGQLSEHNPNAASVAVPKKKKAKKKKGRKRLRPEDIEAII